MSSVFFKKDTFVSKILQFEVLNKEKMTAIITFSSEKVARTLDALSFA